jgi:hypothetical protein
MCKNLTSRTFKTKKFSKQCHGIGITDDDLCQSIVEVMEGKADDLGGGVYKKKLNKNMHRSIVLAKGGKFWIYELIFAKSDRANISSGELIILRDIAKAYAAMLPSTISNMIQMEQLVEICYET